MSHAEHLEAQVKLQCLSINYPVGTKVIIKDNSSDPYETGVVAGYRTMRTDVFLLVNIDDREDNPYIVMGIVRQFDERRAKALDKLTGTEQWNVMSEYHLIGAES